MTSVTQLTPEGLEPPPKPLPMYSLVAAAKRLSSKSIKRMGSGKAEDWQEDAWDMYDLVGEQRFLATTLSNRLAQARFFVGRLPQNTTEEIEPLEEGPAYDVFSTLVGKGTSFTQMVARLGLNLFIPGDGYLLGTPPPVKPGEPATTVPTQGIRPEGMPEEDPLANIDLDTLEWRMLSTSELQVDTSTGEITVEGDDGKAKHKADDVVLIRVWRPHPRKWWQADSPTRSSLPVLRELVGLTMHISAQVDSRLAGAGLLLVPASAEAAMRAAAGADDETETSPFAEALMEAMITPITDRSNASAVVPLTVSVPDESIEKFRLISFSGTLDAEARNLRDEAIRRLALGQDCPPELLLGVAGMNHWGAWLVREDVVTTHLEPPLALICDAITTQFLHPVLEQQGVTDFEDYAVWYDVDHMIMRPNRSTDAAAGHAAGVLNDEAYRDALGFDETAAPAVDPTDPAVILALDMLRGAPSLAQSPGISMLAEQIRAMLRGEVIVVGAEQQDPAAAETPATPADDVADDQPAPEGGTPATDGQDAEEPSLAAGGALADILGDTEEPAHE